MVATRRDDLAGRSAASPCLKHQVDAVKKGWKAGPSSFPGRLRQRDFRGKRAINTRPNSNKTRIPDPHHTKLCSSPDEVPVLRRGGGGAGVGARLAAPPAAGTAPREPLGAGRAAGRRRGGGSGSSSRPGAAPGGTSLASRGGGGGGGGEEGGGGGSAAAFPSVVAARPREKRTMSRAVLAWLVLCGSLVAPRLARGDLCDSNPCKNGGICLSGLNDDFYSCECPEGFTDPNCSSVVEVASIEEEPTSAGPCLPNPCHNGGMCEISEAYRGDTFIGYVCKCPEGFNGIHCQHNVNECESEPCKNGGICTDLVANYSCECPGEFMGRNCQQSK
ncbi:neurogenic locus notch homolog protein 2-like [Coturnix japonica]|uniref:neurogenic locus notch homolog protein 2-like n=1 Tax=Coturnix japonica TaxID=93934 RepID=UPI0013A5C279|nr:neurogenic locus notch homolog protein 2-like [Coturnix japonica]